jgi:hypothetical protein
LGEALLSIYVASSLIPNTQKARYNDGVIVITFQGCNNNTKQNITDECQVIVQRLPGTFFEYC